MVNMKLFKEEDSVKLIRSDKPLISKVALNEYTDIAEKNFDFSFDGTSQVYPYLLPNEAKEEFSIGLIVGSSGSGKSTLLKEFGEDSFYKWSEESIISNFKNPNDAVNRLNAVGLSSVPTWVRPYKVLSNGEKFRSDLAVKLNDNIVIDEFTSVVDREVAKSCSNSVQKFIRRENFKNVVFASCHRDIIDFLNPCWVIDTDLGIFYKRRLASRPKIELSIYETKYTTWEFFKKHHYLDEKINKASKCYVTFIGDKMVGFISVLTQPSGYIKNAYRIHRAVILPEFQGLGIGIKLIETICEEYIEKGCRIFIKTSHPKLGVYMESSKKWISTSHNRQKRTENEKMLCKNWNNYKLDTKRSCFTQEYVYEDYNTKEHNRIGIEIKNDCSMDEFKKLIEPLISKEKYNIFFNGQCGKTNIADEYAIKNNIRREHYTNKKQYDYRITIGGNNETRTKNN